MKNKYIQYFALPVAMLFASCTGKYALYGAAANGNLSKVEQCLANGDDINQVTKDGSTPLMVAAWKGRSDMVRYLLQHGANIEAKDAEGLTALGYAKKHGFAGIEQLLLSAGANAADCGVAAAPASVVNKTLVLDIRNCSYEIELDASEFRLSNGTYDMAEYNEWSESGRRFVYNDLNIKTIVFRGNMAFEDRNSVGNPYSYTANNATGVFKIQYGEGDMVGKLHFKTPTSGVAEVSFCGAIGSEHSNTIHVRKVNFTLK